MPFHQPGYGFFERAFLGSSHRCVYSLFTIEFRKAALKNQLGWAAEFPCSSGEREIVWRERFEDYGEAEKTVLRSKVEKSLGRAIPAVVAEAYKRVQLENSESSK